ncbi:uncharacterized protein METZ01_LOCUS509859 [marine metagenome]|uniref:Uncharacterized protein n=1 Tax=marine metagenome TaxID=408172 RepID=A0A383EL53_9ZZZZ
MKPDFASIMYCAGCPGTILNLKGKTCCLRDTIFLSFTQTISIGSLTKHVWSVELEIVADKVSRTTGSIFRNISPKVNFPKNFASVNFLRPCLIIIQKNSPKVI